MKTIRIKTGAVILATAAAVCCSMKSNVIQERLGRGLNLFSSVLRNVSTFYVDGVDTERLVDTGIRAMLDALDPYTVYYPESETGKLRLMTRGRYAGIGALIGRSGNRIIIREPYAGTPAETAGLLPGDTLLSINGKSTAGLTPDAVSSLLKGEEGEEAVLRISRKYRTDTLEIRTSREQIQLPCIPYAGMAGPTTGYICLRSFTDRSAQSVKEAVLGLTRKGAASLILDLRENGGGLMEQAVDILSLFLPKNTTVVQTRGKSAQSRRTHITRKDPLFPDLPLAVLIDRYSASASEIVAGALQDLDRAVIIGEKSFGKGLVQHIRELPYNAKIKLTTARYHIPSGRCIQALDYAHRNPDGTASRTAEIHSYRTLHGRTVRDGGGIEPDVAVHRHGCDLLREMEERDIVFSFVNSYALQHREASGPAAFRLEDSVRQAFTEYLEKSGFREKSASLELVEKLASTARREGYGKQVEDMLAGLRKELAGCRRNVPDSCRDGLERMLSLHLMRRYHHLRGEVEYRMHNDREILAAQDILCDRSRLRGLLGTAQE